MHRSARTNPSLGRRAFTLLEVLLAVTVMGMITVLIASMNAQLRDWTERGSERAESVRIQRAIEFMRDQWSSRVNTAGGRGEGLLTAPGYLSFVTSAPALDPGAPLVRATYRWVERRTDDGNARYDLIYEESPVGRVGPERRGRDEAQQDRRARGADQPAQQRTESPPRDEQEIQREQTRREALRARVDDPEHTWTLIESCEHGRWERYGQGAIILRNDAAKLEDRAPTSEYALATDAVLRAQRRPSWRDYDEEIPENARAVRIAGERGKEPFTCVFVTAASR